MKERLIELLMKGETEADKQGNFICYVSRDKAEYIADFLLANGVLVPPCKVGDLVYALWEVPTKEKAVIYCAEVKGIYRSVRNCELTTTYQLEPIEFRGRRKEYRDDDFGKTVFHDPTEAKKALAERNNE